MKPSEFKARFSTAKKNKTTNWESLYREAMELFCPNREAFYDRIQGAKKGRKVYSASPAIALDKSSNNLHASLTPHMKRWISLKPGRLIPEEQQKDSAEQLESIRDTFFDHVFTSNFDLAIAEFYKDLLIGTGALMVSGTVKDPIIFTSIPLNELYISTGARNTVDHVYRRYEIKAGVIADTWEDADIPQDIQEIIKTDPDKKFWAIEGTVPKKYKKFDERTEREIEVEGYAYYVMLEKFCDKFLVERNMPISPWVVARWSVMSGEEWGRGPAITCLNDAKTLNETVKLNMQAMELSVHPAYTIVDDGVINIANVRIGPGAMIPVSANDGVFGASLKPLPTGGDLRAGQIELERLETAINDQLYTEPLGSIHLPVKTATEISIRQQELSKRIGSAYGRLQYELIKPLVNLCLYQLDKFNIINMNDFKVDGHTIAIDAISPLALSQQQEEINNVIRYTEFAMGTFGQVGLSLLKPHEIIDFIGEQLNVPPSIMANAEEKNESKQLVQQLLTNQAMGDQGGQPAQ